MINTLARIETRLRLLEQTTDNESIRRSCQVMIKQWRQGGVSTADWLKLQDEAFVNELLKQIPADADHGTRWQQISALLKER